MAKAIVKTGTKPLRARNAVHRAEVERKAAEAKARNEKFAALTSAQKLTKLDAGNRYSGWKPFLARRQRARIRDQVAAQIAVAVADKPAKKGKK